jgi:Fic family protein
VEAIATNIVNIGSKLVIMRRPDIGPTFSDLTRTALQDADFDTLLSAGRATESAGRYYHWDKLRHLVPPNGLKPEQWWAGIKLVRMSAMKKIPLVDKSGSPFQYSVPDFVVRQLHEIDLGAGGAIGMPDPITNPQTRNQYVVRSLIQEAITSSQLEGAVTTRRDAKEMIRSGREPRDKSERMILNNYHTMQRILEWKDRALDERLLLEIHKAMTVDTLDNPDAVGRFRRADEKVTVQDAITGEVFHHPPLAEQLPRRLTLMYAFANETNSARFVHPVVRAMLLHFWLAYDHPFVDGNGRTARALFYWAMLRHGYWLFEFISISEILVEAPAKYARSFLYTETDDNDATYFLVYQAQVIARAIQHLHAYIGKKTEELRATELLMRETRAFNHRQQTLLSHAIRHPGTRYTIDGHRRSHAVAYDTARNDLLELNAEQFLEMKRQGRAFVFLPPPDLEEKVRRGCSTKQRRGYP